MVAHLKVHVLSQQLLVQGLVFEGSVSMANPLSFQHFYGLKYQTGGHKMDAKGYESTKNRDPACGPCQQNVQAIFRSMQASCDLAGLSL